MAVTAGTFGLSLAIFVCLVASAPTYWPPVCENYQPLYASIYEDLTYWAVRGVTEQDMVTAIAHYGSENWNAGVSFLFDNGKAYLTSRIRPKFPGRDALVHYVQVMQVLQEEVGQYIPNIEIVVNYFDVPDYDRYRDEMWNKSVPPLPVLRYCKVEQHTHAGRHIMVPYIHFYDKHLEEHLISKIDQILEKVPWDQKSSLARGQFSLYDRRFYPKKTSYGQIVANPRQYFIDNFSVPHMDVLDVRSSMPMIRYAKHKYVVHLDGWGCSSRLEQYLPLNVVVFKEVTPLKAFYHRAMLPYVHYIPFWLHSPDDLIDGIQWAKDHDEDAEQIAANAREFARKYLNRKALTCYWLKVLIELAKCFKYRPSLQSRKYDYIVSVDDFIANDVEANTDGQVDKNIRPIRIE